VSDATRPDTPQSNVRDGSNSEDDWPQVECPRCGAEQEDMDGFGVIYCESCGYCRHASATGGKCDICGEYLA
jgi:hypothetical protein